MNELSREVEWFVETLRALFGLVVPVDEVAVEAVELGMDEVEDFFVPREVLGELPASLLYELMIYDDELGNEWIGAVAFYPNLPDWCLQVVTKNGELVFRNPLPLLNSKNNRSE